MAGTVRGWGLVAVAALVVAAGCAGAQQKMRGWFGGTSEPAADTQASKAETFYAGVEGLPVYAEPSASAKVVGRLGLHTRVARDRLAHGYAHVTAPGVEGWVDNAQLLWRLPAAGSSPAPAAGPTATPIPALPTGELGFTPAEDADAVPAPDDVPAPAPPPAPVATSTPAARDTPKPPAPSIFDPY